jgi:hypothetical protein
VGAEITATRSVGGLEKVRGLIGRSRFAGLLRGETGAGQIAVQQPGRQLIDDQGRNSASTHPVLPALRMVGRMDDGPGCHFS